MGIIQINSVTKCTLCSKPLLEGEEAHPKCIKDYEQYWDEREEELQYRATTGNDPRMRSHSVWQI